MINNENFTEVQKEIVERLASEWKAQGKNGEEILSDILWIQDLEQVRTSEAFVLAGQGKEVYMIYEDGTDSQLDDIEAESEYYPDKTKSYPEIETIFVIERK